MEDPVIDSNYHGEVACAFRIFRDSMQIYKNIHPHGLLCLAWNDAGTYDAKMGTGGANGSIRHWNRLKYVPYSEMAKALHICEEVKARCPRLTYADIIQIGGVSAIEVAAGPCILFHPGRKDSLASPEEAGFPDANPAFDRLSKLRQMGLTDEKDIVALIGGRLTLERAYRESLVRLELSSVAPVVFDNSYFVDLLRAENFRLWIPSADKDLLGPNFRHYVELYGKDKKAFFKNYGLAHKKFSEFGLPTIAADNADQHRKNNTVLTPTIVVVAIAAAVVVLGCLFKVHSRVE